MKDPNSPQLAGNPKAKKKARQVENKARKKMAKTKFAVKKAFKKFRKDKSLNGMILWQSIPQKMECRGLV